MADRVARALNFLDADRVLFDGKDANNILDFIEEYFVDDIAEPNRKWPLPLITVLSVITTYTTCKTRTKTITKKTKGQDSSVLEDAATVADSSNEVMDDMAEEAEEAVDTDHTAAGIVRHGITDSRIELEDMPTNQRHLDELGELITSYIHNGYSCGFGADKSPCSSTFSTEHYRLVRCGMAELTHDELDLVVMG